MDAFDGIMLVLYCGRDARLGRTAIQKLVYLAGCKIPSLVIPPYRMQYYGPFSEEVGQMLEKLVSFSFISEEKEPAGPHEAYSYSLTADGSKMARGMAAAPEYHGIRSLMDGCGATCDFGVAALSYASKIMYLTREGMPYPEAVRRAEDLDWSLYPGSVADGIRILERLGLADA